MKLLKLYWGPASCCLCSTLASIVLVEDGVERNTYCLTHQPRLQAVEA